MPTTYRQGKFTPRNPKKYKGDVTNIVFRSGWEKTFMNIMDSSPHILQWASEETVLPYISPIDNKLRRYFMDMTIWTEKGITLVEIKPFRQTIPPEPKRGKAKKRLLEEVSTYAVNQAKWNSAMNFCAKNGYSFKIATDKKPKHLPDSQYPTWEVF